MRAFVRVPGSLPPVDDTAAIDQSIAEALQRDPRDALAYAVRGAVLSRAGSTAAAYAAFQAAIVCEPLFAEAHLAAGELATMLGDEARAGAHRRAALALRRHYVADQRGESVTRILALLADRPWNDNIPLDFIIDDRRIAVDRWYLDETHLPRPELVARYPIVFNAMSQGDAAASAVRGAIVLQRREHRPTLNDATLLERTRRDRLPLVLDAIAPQLAPPSIRVDRDGLDDAVLPPFPLIVRPVDAHRGAGLERVDDVAALRAYRDRCEARAFDCASFVDYRSDDGWYRKFRIVYVDGEPYPYHLAISADWIVHYRSSAMFERVDLQREEQRFLSEPAAVIPQWKTTVRAIAQAIGLDYFGIDCGLRRDGSLVVFEADATMLVHALDDPQRFPYKAAAVARIRDALSAAIERRASVLEIEGFGAR